jgi:hypothetical protein
MAQFMVVPDFSIVNVALPTIQRDLHVAATAGGPGSTGQDDFSRPARWELMLYLVGRGQWVWRRDTRVT